MTKPLLSFTIKAVPQPQLRPRVATVGGHPHVYDPQSTRVFKRIVTKLASAEMAGHEPITGPLKVAFTFYRPVQQSLLKREFDKRAVGDELPVVKPDLSNYLKATEDALNGVVWVDDRAITTEVIKKRYSTTPRIMVKIWRDSADGDC